MTGWTLEVNGVEKPFAKRSIIEGAEVLGWGLTAPTITLLNQAISACEFQQPGARFESDALFEMGGTGIIRYYNPEGTPKRMFVGRFRAPRRMGSAESEGFSWRMEDPWWWLTQIVFRQPWKVFSTPTDASSELVTSFSSRLFLGQRVDGLVQVLQNTAEQIIEIVNWAISQGAPLAIDTTDIPEIDIPVMEVRDAFCSECIIKMLQLAPDAVAWFDYTTTPYPTLKIKRRASLVPAVQFDLNDGPPLKGIEAVPRDDLLIDGVVITYERTSTVNGQQLRDLIYDIWGADEENALPGTPAVGQGTTGTGPGVLCATVNMEGANVTYSTATLNTAPIFGNSTDDAKRLAWWKVKRPDLAKNKLDPNNPLDQYVKNLAIRRNTDATYLAQLASHPSEVVQGVIPTWLQSQVPDFTVTAYASYEIIQSVNGTEVIREKFIDEPISVGIKTTALASDTYNNNNVQSIGETIPVGMARALYLANSVLQYDGQLTICESECTGMIRVGNVINIIGGPDGFDRMNALVNQVTYNCETGETQVTFGPSRHLGPDDLMEMLRGLRYRTRWTPLASMANGMSGSGNAIVNIGADAAKESNTAGRAARTKQTWYDPAQPTSFKVIIDIADIVTMGYTVDQIGEIKARLVPIAVRQPDGTCRDGKMVVMAGTIFYPAGLDQPPVV